MEKGNLPNREFKVISVKMFKEFGGRMDEQSGKFLIKRVRKYKEEPNRGEEHNN